MAWSSAPSEARSIMSALMASPSNSATGLPLYWVN